ncbi:vegetative cell wall protein gp1-like isoform X2 [Patiria miniata]|uniref:Uncharacterized protein n=1 Tax=Patiria miniata TaxID=46514 RepID=A0A913ZN67_PATMI|nr:vegetative cell wall protein gp1-like isoform X2 [Patiria miniata]
MPKSRQSFPSAPCTVSRPPDDEKPPSPAEDILAMAAREISPSGVNLADQAKAPQWADGFSGGGSPCPKPPASVTDPRPSTSAPSGTGPGAPRPPTTAQPHFPQFPAQSGYWYPQPPSAPWGTPGGPGPSTMPAGLFNQWGIPVQYFPQPIYSGLSEHPPASAPTLTAPGSHAQRPPAAAADDGGHLEIVNVSDDESESSFSAVSTAGREPFRLPHKKDTGINPISEKVISWWEELRTHKLSSDDYKEEISPYNVPSGQGKFFSAPELPSGLKKVFKQITRPSNSGWFPMRFTLLPLPYY